MMNPTSHRPASRHSCCSLWQALFAVTVSSLMAAYPTVVKAEGFPLRCRGGPNMKIEVRAELPAFTTAPGTDITVHFRRATNPGSVAEPGPGECTWLDRTVNDQEPTNFTMPLKGVYLQLEFTAGGRILDKNGYAAIWVPENYLDSTGLATAFSNIMLSKLVTVVVENSGRTLVASAGVSARPAQPKK